MECDGRLLLLATFVLFAFATEAATGFGSIVIALSFGLHLYPIHVLLPVLVTLDVILSSYMVYRYHDHIARAWLFRWILPLMGIGLAVGIFLFQHVPDQVLRVAFGAFVVVVSVRELYLRWSAASGNVRALSMSARTAGLLGAGVIHGIFASGGPLLVYVLGRSDLDKRSFRSTLATVWLVLNVVLSVVYACTGRIDGGMLRFFGVLVPTVVLSIFLGEAVHDRLDEQRFRVAVFALLVVVGVSILI